MKIRGSVSRFCEGVKRGSAEQQNNERRNQSEHSDEDYGSTATHSRQGKFYEKGGGETGRRQAERRAGRGNPDQRTRTGEVVRREDLGSGKRMDLRP